MLPKLAQKISSSFDLTELRELCFQLNIEYDDLSGTNRKDKVIELIKYCSRRNRLNELISLCSTLRPKITWDFNLISKSIIQTKTELINALNFLHQTASMIQSTSVDSTEVEKLLQQVRKERFTIAVVGEFKRGKSTLVNAILGKEIVPMDILPATATITRITYGETPRAEILFKDGNEDQKVLDIRIENLADYVTKLTQESDNLARYIEQAIVYYPLSLCNDGIDIVDTPGISDEKMLTQATHSLIPQASLIVFVLMPESPFSGYEGEFLKTILLQKNIDQVIFVITAIDRIRRKSDRERVQNGISSRIQNFIKHRFEEQLLENKSENNSHPTLAEPHIISLSGYEALEAKLNHDEDLLKSSGLLNLETVIQERLNAERLLVEPMKLAKSVAEFSGIIIKQIDRIILTKSSGAKMPKLLRNTTELQQMRQKIRKIQDQAYEHLTQLEL